MEDFVLKDFNGTELRKLVEEQEQKIFNDQLNFWPRDFLSDSEKDKLESLSYKNNFNFGVAVLKGEEVVAWSYGFQISRESYLMASSAVLPEYRNRGLYTKMLKHTLSVLTEKGFQRIDSYHKISNNSILIPKLKAGFIIVGTRLNDMSGMSVVLAYYTNSLRQKVMKFRGGDLRPDQEIKDIFKL